MKPQIKLSISNAVLLLTFLSIVTISCQKETKHTLPNEEIATASNNNKEHGHLKQTKEFSSDVVIQWLNLDLDLLRTPLPAGTTVQGGERILAYSGIALYEAVVNGMPAYQSLNGQLTGGFPTMPSTEPGKAYHWATAANAALAEVTRHLFDTASSSTNSQVRQQRLDKINSKENQLQAVYATEADASVINRSIDFGKQVAKKVNDWAKTDGWDLQNNPYTPPLPTAQQPWLWVPTATTAPINPHVELRRLLVPGSDNGATIAPFPPFSTFLLPCSNL